MRILDFWIIILCCLAWAGNLTLSAWVLGGSSIPPFMLATVRATLVLLVLGVFLFRPLPPHFLRLLFVCLCVGPVHLGFLYTGLQTASASGSSIVSQALIPLSTLISIVWLKEGIGWRRGLAILGALIGVIIMIYEPGALRGAGGGFDMGLLYVLTAYAAMALGSVAIRRVPDVDWRVYVAWTSLLLLFCGVAASFVFESDQAEIFTQNWKILLLAAGYAALTVAIIAHGQYFRLLQRYPVNQVVPLTLLTTPFACALGILLLGETLYPRYIVGAVLILPCVYIIARRNGGGEAL